MESEKIRVIKEWLGTGSINFFGPPFAGKDSQARLFAELLDGVVIGGGDILRSVAPESVKSLINEGKLAPTDEYIRIVLPYLSREEFSEMPLLLSSVGRWKGEEQAVVPALKQASHPLKAVVYLSLDTETIRQRLLSDNDDNRGVRDDDYAHKLEHRINEFEEKTLPVIDYYRTTGALIEIDGAMPKDNVTESIIDELYTRATA